MDDTRAAIGRTRLITWPLAAFLANLLLIFPPSVAYDGEATDILAVSVLMGTAWAIAALIAAAILNPRLGPTSSGFPFQRGKPWRAVLFCACVAASLTLKLSALYGLVSLLLGAIAIWLVADARILGPGKSVVILAERATPQVSSKSPMDRRWLIACVLLAAWASFSWLRYHMAINKVDECNSIFSVGQMDICVRQALDARDSAIVWGVGLPLGLLIAGWVWGWILRDARRRRR